MRDIYLIAYTLYTEVGSDSAFRLTVSNIYGRVKHRMYHTE